MDVLQHLGIGEVWGRFGRLGDILRHLGMFGDVWNIFINKFQLVLRMMQYCIMLSWAWVGIADVLVDFGTFLDVSGRFATLWDILQHFTTLCEVCQHFATFCDILGLFGTFGDN